MPEFGTFLNDDLEVPMTTGLVVALDETSRANHGYAGSDELARPVVEGRAGNH